VRSQQACIIYLWGLNELPVYKQMEIPVCLLFYRFHNPWVAMTGITNADTADEIEPGPAIGTIQIMAFGSYDLKAQGVGRSLGDMAKK